jgi:hypothetical protein
MLQNMGTIEKPKIIKRLGARSRYQKAVSRILRRTRRRVKGVDSVRGAAWAVEVILMTALLLATG